MKSTPGVSESLLSRAHKIRYDSMKSTPGVSESLLSRAQLFEILRRFRARVFLQLDDDAAQSFERAVARQFQVEVHFRVALVHRQRNGVRDVVAFRQSDDVFHGRANAPSPGNG